MTDDEVTEAALALMVERSNGDYDRRAVLYYQMQSAVMRLAFTLAKENIRLLAALEAAKRPPEK